MNCELRPTDLISPRRPVFLGAVRRVARMTAVFASGLLCLSSVAQAQVLIPRIGEAVPREVREIYDRGLQYLAASQTQNGDWTGGGHQGPGITGLGLMAFLASGEDPNYGIYSNNIRRALRSIIGGQDPTTGYFGNSMYHHGFAMLSLAEAYGAVDDRDLWAGAEGGKRFLIGQALEAAVRTAITSQKKNATGAWRYSPDANDADTSVSGAILVGLLAARNAGIEVPDESIDKAIAYYRQMTSNSGQVAYSGGIGGFDESLARISIGALVYSIARRKDIPQFKATVNYLTQRLETPAQHHSPDYTRYYQSQALFQGDVEAWEKWNKLLIRQLKTTQHADGSFNNGEGAAFSTSMSLLALALNYRFLPIYER